MRTIAAAAAILAAAIPAAPRAAAGKLTFDERVELTRGLMAEYATVKAFLPRSKKPLPFESSGTYDKQAWDEAGKQFGPAARVGDLVQVTKVMMEDDKIVLEINNGMKGGRKWYQGVQIGMGTSTAPISTSNSNAPSGTSIVLLFHKPISGTKVAEIKKMLAPVLDFEKHSATEIYAENLPPEVKKAIQEKRVTEGMDREQVIMAVGRPNHKSREVQDGMELEYWVFGEPPGKITFVTFNGNKVIKVREQYAGLGTEVANPKPPL
jgi:hypothetical protein